MPPQQPVVMPPRPGATFTPPNTGNQYEFILNHNKHTANAWLLGLPLKTRIIMVASGLGVLLLIIIIFAGLLLNSGSNTTPLLTVAQEQNELARISLNPISQATSPSTQGIAATIRLSILTDQQATIAYLKAVGSPPSASDLAKTRSIQTDAALTQAQTDGTYDQTYLTLVHKELTTYEQSLKQAFAIADKANERSILSQTYAHAQLLVEQSNATD